MKTFMAKPQEVDRKWYVIDAEGQTLGRLATRAASILKGKHKPTYTPHVDTGDFVIVINAEKIKLTGKKWQKKTLTSHSGYIGGIKHIVYADLLQKNPQKIVEHAVKGMIPNTKLGKRMGKKLKVYVGPEHPHSAQQPEELKLES